MKLHTMTFRGMGPFAQEQVIDFDALSEAGMFLLEGPTGVGKSTIIDALVFALYGKVAGKEADDGRLVSDFRDLIDPPFVDLVFTTAQGTFRVRRTPSHLRPRSRGTGDPVQQNATANLSRLDRPDDPDGEPLASGPQEVGAEILRAIGLDRDQFVRTIVLPQGEFATFLRTDTKDRRPLLQRIFRTYLYQDLQQRLKDAGKQAKNRREAALDSVAAALNQLRGTIGEEELSGQDGSTESAELLGLLDDVVADKEQSAADANQAETVARTAAEQAATDLADIDARIELRDSLAAARQRETALRASAAAVDLQREALAADVRAGRVADALANAKTATDVHRTAEHELAAARATAPPDLAALSAEALAAARAQLQQTIGSLATALADEAALPDKEQEIADRRASADSAASAASAHESRLAELPAQQQEAADRLADLHQRAAQKPAHSAALAATRSRAAAALQLPAAQAEGKKLEEMAAKRLAEHDRAEKAESLATARYRLGIAATLGMALVPGEPCPACGSAEHPNPATADAHHVSADDVDAAARATATARTALDAAADAHGKHRERISLLIQRAEGLDSAEAEDAVEAAAEQLANAEAAANDIGPEKDRAAELSAEAARVAQELQRAKAAQAALSAEIQQLELGAEQLRQRIRAAAAGHPSVAAHDQALRERGTHLDLLISAEQGMTDAQLTLEAAESRQETALRRERFESPVAAREAALTDAQREAATTSVQAHEKETIEVAALLDRADLQGVDPDEAIDREPAAQTKLGAETAAAAATKASVEAAQTARLTSGHAATVRAAVAKRDKVFEQTATDVLLAQVAEGNNAMRIDLATYVLVHRFRSVIAAANHHLMRMSNGRLMLESFEEAQRANERAGLGIRIRDLHTETTRSTKSLSGGETFYASLSLALGLAEIVAAESGGIELDTLFVDEGFGSLDPETLDDVMGVLDGLQRNGRVLGLVSHVTEMKERIAERIEVRRVAQTGASTLRIVA